MSAYRRVLLKNKYINKKLSRVSCVFKNIFDVVERSLSFHLFFRGIYKKITPQLCVLKVRENTFDAHGI